VAACAPASPYCPKIPKHMWKGAPYPETVVAEADHCDGRPNVKLARRGVSGLLIGASPTQPTSRSWRRVARVP